jgi:hypothetical protein
MGRQKIQNKMAVGTVVVVVVVVVPKYLNLATFSKDVLAISEL